MVNLFLKAKHWQLFLLLFVIPIVTQVVTFAMFFSELIKQQGPPDPATMINYFKIFPLVMLLFMGLQFAWIWSVVTGLQQKIPAGIVMKLKRFKILFFIPLFYFVFLSVFIAVSFDSFQHTQPQNLGLFLGMFIFIIPLHLGTMFCIFHNMYFTARTIKIAELQRSPKGDEFIGEFFMMWFFPIGIWFLQPRINLLAAQTTEPFSEVF